MSCSWTRSHTHFWLVAFTMYSSTVNEHGMELHALDYYLLANCFPLQVIAKVIPALVSGF